MAEEFGISIEGLKKTYRSRKTGAVKEALKGIDLKVPKGSFFGLLGPNGAGKSTLINIMAGVVVKSAGRVMIEGHDIETETRVARSSIGVVPQELVLDPFFPVFEALENYAGYYGIPKSKRRTKAIIDAVGLTDQAYVPARRLSGGMKRRLLVAKAMVHSPPVLVLDEPTAGVDVELREQLWDYVRELNEAGTTILLTTHYLEEAEELCDHIAVINHGELVVQDSKQALLSMIDRKKVTIVTEEKTCHVPEALQAYDTVITEQGNLCITYQSSQVSFDHLLKADSKSNVTIKDLSTEEADLEDIFRHLTRASAA